MVLNFKSDRQGIQMNPKMHSLGFQNLYLFIPAYNVENSINNLLKQLEDLGILLYAHHCALHVRIINDASTDKTKELINARLKKSSFIELQNNVKNRGNGHNIIAGYQWAFSQAQNNDLIGCLDADGEHSPLALRRHIDYLGQSNYDGIVGTIVYPEEQVSRIDLNMMQFLGRLQASAMGIHEPFYIQSSGYQLHRSLLLKRVIGQMLPLYLDFFSQQYPGPLPNWGIHGVIDHLLCLAGAKLKTVYLECFGSPPNRDLQKLRSQANAALIHLEMIEQFHLATRENS